jgi:hypothetical protein
MQIRGGRGYETAASLKARGETPEPVERCMRDSRINTIFEGSSEIMRLFIAREMLDVHLKTSAAVLNSQLPRSQRLRAAAKAAWFYLGWYPKLWLPFRERIQVGGAPGPFDRHLRYAARTSRRLARAIFHALLLHGPKLEREQLLLGRFVDIGTEVFAITATCSRAANLLSAGDEEAKQGQLSTLVDWFCDTARLRIEQKFCGIHRNSDRQGYRLAQQVLSGKLSSLTAGIVVRK